jgi:hypothetical protein
MAGFAERLPVHAIPEQGQVALVRLDVIDFVCEGRFALAATTDTERVFRQECRPRFLPLPAI